MMNLFNIVIAGGILVIILEILFLVTFSIVNFYLLTELLRIWNIKIDLDINLVKVILGTISVVVTMKWGLHSVIVSGFVYGISYALKNKKI